MKFAICNETFVDWPLDRACDFAAQCGYTGLEIAPFTLAEHVDQISAAQRAEVCKTADRAGLEIIGLHWLLAKTTGLHVTTADAAARRRAADYLASLAHLCRDLGGSLMVFGSPLQRNVPPDVAPAQAKDHFCQVLESALPTFEQTGVTLAVEPLGPVEGNFLNTAADAVEIIQRLASPHCRLHLDCKAMSTESDSIPTLLQRHQQVLAHFHANDPNRLGPGMGDLDFAPILQALGQIDYHGWVSVEVFDYSPGPERLAQESINNLRACLEDLAK